MNAILLAIAATTGGCHVQAVQAVQHHAVVQQVVTPFAIPVAVPVAAIANPGVYYSHASYSTAAQTQPQGLDEERLAVALARALAPLVAQQRADAGTLPATLSESYVSQHCAKCHTGSQPAGGFSLAGEWTCEKSLRAIRKVMSPGEGKMKAVIEGLGPEKLGLVLQELAESPVAKGK